MKVIIALSAAKSGSKNASPIDTSSPSRFFKSLPADFSAATHPELVKALLKGLTSWPLKSITKEMNKPSCPAARILFPSLWGETEKPYPGKLAEALIASSAEEALTDFMHQYYSRDRELTPAARKVFMDFLLANPKKLLNELSYAYDLPSSAEKATKKQIQEAVSDIGGLDAIAQGFDEYYSADPKGAKKLLMLLPATHLQVLAEEFPQLKLQPGNK